MHMDKYYLALGRFVDHYAKAESTLFVLLIFTARTSMEVGRAVFSGTRASGGIDFIRRIYEARLVEQPSLLVEGMQQLSAITKARDHILHTGAYLDAENARVVSANLLRAHAEKSRKLIDASPSILEAMTIDLVTIDRIMSAHIMVVASADGVMPDDLRRTLPASPVPWRYRPDGSETQRLRSQGTTRKRSTQPKASLG